MHGSNNSMQTLGAGKASRLAPTKKDALHGSDGVEPAPRDPEFTLLCKDVPGRSFLQAEPPHERGAPRLDPPPRLSEALRSWAFVAEAVAAETVRSVRYA